MRLFLAIEVPDKIKSKIDEMLVEIKNKHQDFNWTPANKYHITIFFFGEVNHIDKIETRIDKQLFDVPSFYLYSNNVDLFIHNKITVYLDFLRNRTIETIGQKIKDEFTDGPINNNQKFVPHLTLARYRIPSKQQYFVIKKQLEKLSIDVEFKVDKLVLFESVLSGDRPEYKVIKKFKLLKSE